METDVPLCDIRIIKEEIEILDIEPQEEEEELEEGNPSIGVDDCEVDVRVPHLHKGFCNFDTKSDNISYVETDFMNTAEGSSTKPNNLEAIVKNTSDIRIEFVQTPAGINHPVNKRTSIINSKNLSTFADLSRTRKKVEMTGGQKVLKQKVLSKSSESSQQLYSCQHCDFQTCFSHLFSNHQRRHNPRHQFTCSKCSYSSRNYHTLVRHIGLIHENLRLSCNECDFKCSMKRQLKNHMFVHTNKSYFKCSDCDFKHIKQAVLRRHMVIHSDNKHQLMCIFCGYKGVKPEYLTRHMKKRHKAELDFENALVGAENVDNSLRGSNDHLIKDCDRNIIKKQPVVLLTRCDEDVDGVCKSAVNMGKIHDQILQYNFFDVAKCGEPEDTVDPELLKSFNQQEDSTVIMKSTLITKGKNVITSIVKVIDDDDQSTQPQAHMSDLRSEVKRLVSRQIKSKQRTSIPQTDVNPIAINEVVYDKSNHNSTLAKVFRCQACSFVSTWADRFEKHLKLHSGQNFSCNECDFVTNSQNHLDHHKRSKHCKKKQFKCKNCDYRGSTSQNLKVHMKRHEELKRFKCDKCNFRTMQATKLKKHMMNQHVEEKPFACDLCDFRTKFKVSLRNHRFVHTGETKYVCEICNYKFNVNATLKKHMEIHGPSK